MTNVILFGDIYVKNLICFFFLFIAIALISIYTAEHLEHLTLGHNCEIVDYQPRPGADINGDEEYERLFSSIFLYKSMA